MRKIVKREEVDTVDEVQRMFQKVFDNQCLLEAKVEQLQRQVDKIPVKKAKKKDGFCKLPILIMLMLVPFVVGAYVADDINYEIASNPELLVSYLEDTIASGSHLFTPTDTAPATSEGNVYYNDTANALQLYNGTSWQTLSAGSGNTLDGAYDSGGAGSGRSILATDGAVNISSTDADTAFLVTLNASPGSSAALGGIEITSGANTTESCIEIENSGTGYDWEGTAGGYLTKAGDLTLLGTTPYITIGDAGAEDAGINFDGHTGGVDWHIASDDSADSLEIGVGTTVETDERLTITGSATETIITIGDAAAEDMSLNFDGNAQDFHISLDDSDDSLEIGFGTTIETDERITINGSTTETIIEIGDAATEDMRIEFDGNAQNYHLALDDSADDFIIGRGSTIATTEYLTFLDDSFMITVGDASEGDSGFTLDGNEDDFYISIDDSANDFVIGYGSTVGTDNRLTIRDDSTTVVLGDGVDAEDKAFILDGNAGDFYMAYDDSADDLVFGSGATIGTDVRLSILDGATVQHVKIGDAAAEDMILSWDGNAQDFHIALDDSSDSLEIGFGTTVETDERITIDGSPTETIITLGDAAEEDTSLNFDGNAQDFHISLDDSDDSLEIGFGTTIETDERITINGSPTETIIEIGDAATEDMRIEFDGNAQNYHLALDDSADDFIIGKGSTIATTEYLTFLDDSFQITVGDASAADSGFSFDGNAQDYAIGIDDSADDLLIQNGTTLNDSTAAININSSQVVTFAQPIVMNGGQTRMERFEPKVVELDGTAPPTLTDYGTDGQTNISAIDFDADGGANGDDICFISWKVPDGYVVDSARLNVAYTFDTAEDVGADEAQFDFTVNAVAAGEALDAAGTALADQTTVISDATADNGKLHVTQYNIEVEDIAVDDLVTIQIAVDESASAIDQGNFLVLYFEIEYESTE